MGVNQVLLRDEETVAAAALRAKVIKELQQRRRYAKPAILVYTPKQSPGLVMALHCS